MIIDSGLLFWATLYNCTGWKCPYWLHKVSSHCGTWLVHCGF